MINNRQLDILRLGGVSAVWLAMAVAISTTRADGIQDEIAGHLERIDYYERALNEQREAAADCRDKGVDAHRDYQEAVDHDDAENAEALQVRIATFNGLARLYLGKMLGNMQTLAAENDQLGQKYEKTEEFQEAANRFTVQAQLWEAVAESAGSQADETFAADKFSAAAGFYEKCSGNWSNARTGFQNTLRCVKRLGGEARTMAIKDSMTACANRAFGALESARDAFFDAYRMHQENAEAGDLDIFSKRIGDEWHLTAKAQQNYERLCRQVHDLERQRKWRR
jgi:hypothetical protein